MNIAFLISAYKDPLELKNLIDALKGEGSYFFIHVDKKVDIDAFKDIVPEYKRECQGLSYTAYRYYVYWGGWNQVRYQKELLRSCIEIGVDFDRIVLITAQDYPLVSREKLFKIFQENKDKEYLTGLNLSKLSYSSPINKNQLNKITRYHFFRDFFSIPKSIQGKICALSYKLLGLLPPMKKPYVTVNKEQKDVWLSSSYFSLSWKCAKYVYECLENKKEYIRYFRWTFVPEELLIPTIIFNSDFARNATIFMVNDYPGLSKLSALTYFNYGKQIQIFDESSYTELVNANTEGGHLFARKFSSDKSAKLIEILKESNDNKPLKFAREFSE